MNQVIIYTASFFMIINVSFATAKIPYQCQTLQCVRKNIDIIDKKLVSLIGKRLSYVKRAGEIKKNLKPIHDQAREDKILQNVGEQAKNAGYSSNITIAVFKTILSQANIYEKHIAASQKQLADS